MSRTLEDLRVKGLEPDKTSVPAGPPEQAQVPLPAFRATQPWPSCLSHMPCLTGVLPPSSCLALLPGPVHSHHSASPGPAHLLPALFTCWPLFVVKILPKAGVLSLSSRNVLGWLTLCCEGWCLGLGSSIPCLYTSDASSSPFPMSPGIASAPGSKPVLLLTPQEEAVSSGPLLPPCCPSSPPAVLALSSASALTQVLKGLTVLEVT